MSGLESVGNWLHHVWFAYFWTSLQGNGPEDLLSYLLIGGGVAWLGRWCLKEWKEHKAHLKIIHAKVNHVILNHPDIPNKVPGLADEHQPTQP